MEKFEKILVLDNEFEAERLTEMLNGRNIPHGIVSSEDSVLGAIEKMEIGWGYLEAPIKYYDEIMEIFKEIRNK